MNFDKYPTLSKIIGIMLSLVAFVLIVSLAGLISTASKQLGAICAALGVIELAWSLMFIARYKQGESIT